MLSVFGGSVKEDYNNSRPYRKHLAWRQEQVRPRCPSGCNVLALVGVPITFGPLQECVRKSVTTLL